MPRILVTTEDFDVGAELARLESGAGAIASFVGVVRGESDGRELAALTLEHYPGMTETALAGIAETAMTRWRLTDCVIIHRIGRLVPGSRIVLAAASSAHRGDALEATAFLIDWLKTDAPFWKREDFAEGGSAWVEARTDDQKARDRWQIGGTTAA
ncbi:molybdenum cofactor biosynthesis protein MoaE [Acidiphilium iwatense]|uniref:Molybdopterin synthase catalytic subunit n=1 Tax=Acidiphilium iwatense TaxID=768198 RepID=A0ABS9DYU8_9PROT|nr:molybdenum cofactor biosynthesis protein MoaE [Acidiphilium iwatense]MCF3947931.1 molybdenum cofactor biosynthesis protein MoaE [Acidiphilium iwatense]